jgi:hypothetical protein
MPLSNSDRKEILFMTKKYLEANGLPAQNIPTDLPIVNPKLEDAYFLKPKS